MKASQPHDEAARLEDLHQYDILDTGPEEQFDDLTHLAAQICGAPISAIALLDRDRLWFKSCVGQKLGEMPRADTFCVHAILQPGLMIVPDATQDQRFSDNPCVTGALGLRFYAGMPLVTPTGHTLGTLCVLDTKVRQLDEVQQDSLCRLGRQVMALLEARRELTVRLAAEKAEREGQRFLQSTIDALSAHLAVLDERGEIVAVNKAWRQFAEGHIGSPAACGVGANYLEECDHTQGKDCEKALQAARGICEVMAGDRDEFCIEYPCHSDDQKCWLNMCATRFAGDGPVRVVISHDDITPSKLAEQELQNSQSQFENMEMNVPGVVYQVMMQTDGITYWPYVGQDFEELFESSPDVLKNNPTWMREQAHPDDREDFIRSIMVAKNGFLPHDWEGRIRLASGTTKWIHFSARPQRVSDGILWNGLALDVTVLRGAEEERDRFFSISRDLLCIADKNSYFTRLNPAFETMLGYTHDELMSRPFFEWVHPDDRAATIAAWKKLEDGRSLSTFVNRWRHKDGSYLWLSWGASPHGNVVYATAHNITPLKQAETALHEANDELELRVQERTAEMVEAQQQVHAELAARNRTEETLRAARKMLQLVIDHIPRAIFWKDRNCIYLGCNSRLAQDAGYGSSEELIGKSCYDMPWAEQAPAFQEDDRQVMETDTPKLNIEESLTNADGSTLWLCTNKIPLHDSQGNVMGVLGSYEDITLQKESVAALRQARDDAERANLAKSEFLSRMSHELRTPLNAILGFGQILDKQGLDEQQQECVGHILKGGRHLLDLINEVLDISRVEAGQLHLSLEPISLAEMVYEACALMRPLAIERHLRLIEHFSQFENHYALADRVRLLQVLLNLLGNAIKYNRDGGQVEVVCGRKPNGPVTITVRDTGPGITPENMAKIFVPFERLGIADAEIEGTGLGLTLSQQLMMAMNGTLTLQSTPGQGTIATIELPPAEEPQISLAHPSARRLDVNTPPTNTTWKLLCIEDNPSNLRLVEVILEARPGVTLLNAVQGSVGLDLARQHEPDLIMLDLDLPDLHGKEVLERLQQSALTRDIPVVVVSADASPHQIQRLLGAGAKEYLIKPLDVERFLGVLDKYFQGPSPIASPGDNH